MHAVHSPLEPYISSNFAFGNSFHDIKSYAYTDLTKLGQDEFFFFKPDLNRYFIHKDKKNLESHITSGNLMFEEKTTGIYM